MSRTTITRLSDKASGERAALDALLDSVQVGHFAFVADDAHPVVLPTAVVRDGNAVLAHSSTGSPWLRRLPAGAPTSLAVTAFVPSLRWHIREVIAVTLLLLGAAVALRAVDRWSRVEQAMRLGRALLSCSSDWSRCSSVRRPC